MFKLLKMFFSVFLIQTFGIMVAALVGLIYQKLISAFDKHMICRGAQCTYNVRPNKHFNILVSNFIGRTECYSGTKWFSFSRAVFADDGDMKRTGRKKLCFI